MSSKNTQKKSDKGIHVSGKRKMSIARATLSPGKGIVKINNILIDFYEPKVARMRIQEPLIIAGDLAKNVDITVRVNGGGIMSSADAARLAIARALVKNAEKSGLRDDFLNYDRNLLVADVRYKEQRKPNDSKARAKRQKSYR